MGKVKILIDRASGRSLTDQLADGLRTAVRLGRWKEGERLPTREELMASCGVSRNVVQAAVRRLVAEGLVVTRPRLGCTVARQSRRAVRGRVLMIVTGSEVPYWPACFTSVFRRELRNARIDCQNICLSYDRKNRFDRERLEYELALGPDLVIVMASLSRKSELQRFIDARDIPYVMAGESSRGRHPHLLWAGRCADDIDLSGFVNDCVQSKVRSVMWLAYSMKSDLNPCAALEKVGISVEPLLACKDLPDHDVDLSEWMECGRDCILRRMSKGPLCDLLFVADDYLAMGAISALLENGLRMPQDIRLVTQYSRGFGPVLTKTLARVELDPDGCATEIARGVVEWFKTDKFPELNILQPVYVRGETFPVLPSAT